MNKAKVIFHGSPCQDFSLAGKQAGGEQGSGTRSSLLYETIRIVEKTRPDYVIWENVKNVISKKHRQVFDDYLTKMEQLGYKNYYQVLNAKDYGIPQNRERVFCISILSDVNNFVFPPKQELQLKLKDLLEDKVDEKYYLSEKKIGKIANWKAYQKPFEKVQGNNSICPTLTARGAGEEHSGMITYCEQLEETTNLQIMIVKEATKKGYAEAKDGDSINLEHPNSKTRRGRVDHQVAQTLTTSCNQAVFTNYKIRKLTPKECWRLMGFDDADFEKAAKVNSNRQLYKQAGNSIVVNLLEAIFTELFKNEEHIEMIELFGGIGAPRKALINIGKSHNIFDYVEYDKFLVASYNAIYGTDHLPQDVSLWDKEWI